jgi:AraC-like DNA-binding protein
MKKSRSIEYLTAGKYISERAPMIHPRRRISSFVLIYGVKGTLYISDGGNEYAVSPNEFLFLVADREHVGVRYSSPGISYYWCHFYIKEEYRLKKEEGDGELLVLDDMALPTYGKFSEPSKMHLLFHQLIDSSKSPGANARFISERFLEIILAEIAKSFTTEKGKNFSRAVESITEWIRLNAPQINGVGNVAANFGYNSEYLTTMIKKATGKTLTEYITESRIELSKEYLRTTNKTARAIAYECGFLDEKYFLRVFKKYTDVTPTEYRNTYAKQKTNDK